MLWNIAFISKRYRDIGGHDLDLSGSRDVIGHVTIWLPGSNFLSVLHCHQVSISSRFRDTGPQTYWGHDLDLSRWRDVIGHMTIGLGMGHFLGWSFGPKSLSLTVSKIFRPKHHVLIDTMLNHHCACAISHDVYPYVKFKYIFQFLTPTLPIHYVTFIELRWRIRGFLSLDL